MPSQEAKGRAFRALHERQGAFMIPNPWDIGSARLLAHLGFEALATTSAGFAFTLGLNDQHVPRDVMIAHVGEIASATDLPVSGDLENGYGDTPDAVAETIRLAAQCGLVGCSIEDSTRGANRPVYEIEHGADRIRAAAEAARSLPFPFTLTARAENFIVGRPDLADTIARLQTWQAAGADVLYAPGIVKREDIAAVVSSVDRPVNVLMGIPRVGLSLAEPSALGVKRVSVGSGLARAAESALLRAAKEMKNSGTFTFMDEVAKRDELMAFIK